MTISIMHEIKKRGHSRWYVWDDLLEGYYMITKDKDGNPNYDMFN